MKLDKSRFDLRPQIKEPHRALLEKWRYREYREH